MQLAWDAGEVTVTDVWKALAERRPVARNTVLTLMERLTKKGWLCRQAHDQTFVYAAAVPRADTLGQLVRRLIDAAFAGSADALVSAMIEGRGLSDIETQRIRTLIDNAPPRRRKS
jgi:predicted transcriptional regulator